MRSDATTPEEYIASVPDDRRAVVAMLRALIKSSVPGATERIEYGMLGYAYEGRPFAALASQKNYLALYLMDLYTQPGLREQHAAALAKLDVGKSCVRFKPDAELPLDAFRAILAAAPRAVVTSGTMAAKRESPSSSRRDSPSKAAPKGPSKAKPKGPSKAKPKARAKAPSKSKTR